QRSNYLADTAVGKAAVRSGQIDNWYTTGLTHFEDLLNTNPELIISVVPRDTSLHTMWDIQWKNPVWGAGEAGLKMRRALSLALDRRAVNDLVYGGGGVPSHATSSDSMSTQ